MLIPSLDTGGVSEKKTDNMGSHSYRLRVCGIDIKSREIDVYGLGRAQGGELLRQ